MKILEKIKSNPAEGVKIAFLGDSVTYGAFELYRKEDGSIGSIDDQASGYASCFMDMLKYLFPNVTFHAVNAGISGDHARNGAKRVESDVAYHKPDLTVVCYGLNDCGDKVIYAERYVNALAEIFDCLKNAGSEVIFMTPNMMNTTIGEDFVFPELLDFVNGTMQRQVSGVFDVHIERAKEICREKNVPICDCYAIWKNLAVCGVDTTALLCNRINHPSREMHKVFAYELIRTLFG